MSDREAFVTAIAANPDDDLPRLVFADWLDENGDPERAEFIRTQIRWHHAFPDERKELDRKADELFRGHAHRWFGPFAAAFHSTFDPAAWSDLRYIDHPARAITFPPVRARKPSDVAFDVQRGFVSRLTVDVSEWRGRGSLAEAFRLEPVCGLLCVNGLGTPHWAEFTDPCLRQVRNLVAVQQWVSVESELSNTAFLDDPYLIGVRRFTARITRIEGNMEHSVPLPVTWVERFVRSPLASRLTALELFDTPPEGVRRLCQPRRLNLERFGLYGGELTLTPESVDWLGWGVADTVQELTLCGTRIGDAGVEALVSYDWKRMTHLGLRCNRLRTSVTALARAALTPRLVKLDLSQNRLVTEELTSGPPPEGGERDMAPLRKLADALDPDRLEHLDLSGTGLREVPDFLGERFGERVTV